jgi:hypothetical protein
LVRKAEETGGRIILQGKGSRGISVSIEIGYGLDDQGSIPGRGKDGIFIFGTASRPALRVTMGTAGSYPGGKAAG